MAISCATGLRAAGSLVSVTAIDPEARADTAASAGTPICICWARALGRANRKTRVRRAARRRYPVRSPSLRSREAAAQTRDSTRGLLELPHLNCETLACKSGTAQSGSIIFPVVRPIPPTLHKQTVQLGDFRVPENVRCIFKGGRTDAGLKRSTVASFGWSIDASAATMPSRGGSIRLAYTGLRWLNGERGGTGLACLRRTPDG